MLETLIIVAVGLMPPLLSVWVMGKTQARTQQRLRQALATPVVRQRSTTECNSDRYYLEGVGYLIGDISCQFNARSGYLRCAVNPQGPCQSCYHYQPREVTRRENSA